MAKPSQELDPELLLAAAHELGHAVVNTALGVAVVSIELDRDNYTGLTTIDINDNTSTAEELRSALIGSLAGFEAERMWCRRHGGQVSRACSRTDFDNFRRNRHRVNLTETVARHEARTTLSRDWTRVERLAPRLAHHGHLRPW